MDKNDKDLLHLRMEITNDLLKEISEKLKGSQSLRQWEYMRMEMPDDDFEQDKETYSAQSLANPFRDPSLNEYHFKFKWFESFVLNEMGKDGWELVSENPKRSIWGWVSMQKKQRVYLFKRPQFEDRKLNVSS